MTKNFSQIMDFLDTLIPFASALILFILASAKEKKISSADIYKERLEKYYIPFYKMYCRGFLFELPASEISVKNALAFLDLFSENLVYMDTQSQCLYVDYYKAVLNLMEAEDSKSECLAQCKNDFSIVFSKMASSTFAEYKHLLKKLKMPVPKI